MTRSPRSRRVAMIAATTAAAVSGTLLPPAHSLADPLFTVDIRVHDTGGKTATVSNLGDVVLMDIFAVIHDGDGIANESFEILHGSELSSYGGVKGNLVNLNPATFDQYQSGTQRDLDGDGDLDVGSLNQSNADGFVAWASNMPKPVPAGGLYLGQIQFTASDLSAGGSTDVNWQYRVNPSNLVSGNTVWFDTDGVQWRVKGNSPLVGVAAPVTISFVPPIIPPGDTRNFDVWSINAAESNAGGTVIANEIRVGNSAAGSYAQSSGFTNATKITVGAGANNAGTWTQTGGNVISSNVAVGSASGGMMTIGGSATATYSALGVGNVSSGGTGRLEVTAGGQLTVTGTATYGGFAAATLVHSGGTSNYLSTLNLKTNASASISAGTLNARFLALSGNATVSQTGGAVAIQGSITMPPKTASTGTAYDFVNGTLDSGELYLGATFRQQGGITRVDHFHADQNAASRIELTGGSVQCLTMAVGDTRGGPVDSVMNQSGGAIGTWSFDVSPRGRYEMSAGSISISGRMMNAGVVDLGGGAPTLTFGEGAFVDFANYWGAPGSRLQKLMFSGGQLLNGSHASIVAGKNSFLNFPVGFDLQHDLGSIASQGIVHIAGQPVTIPSSQTLGASGGISGDVVNSGVVAPGDSSGASLMVDGAFTQTSTGNMSMEIGGTADDTYDTLAVSGAASVDGTLQVSLLNGFVPAPTDTFTILTAASVSGVFANAPSTISFPGGTFDVNYSPTAVTLTNFVVPEPGTAGLLAGGMLVFLRGRRRRVSR